MQWGFRHRAKSPISAIVLYVPARPEEIAALDGVMWFAKDFF
jgi:hypothetical protein